MSFLLAYNNCMEEFPFACSSCQTVNMVQETTIHPVDKIKNDMGYICENCGSFQHLFFTTQSMIDAIKKLERTPISHSKFRFLFFKTLHKMMELQVKHGS